MKKLLIVILAILLLAGCSQQQVVFRQRVVLVDMSASIEPQAATECFDAIAKLISKLDRGDSVTIIPITGDADVQSSGRVLRFQKPVTRTAYDADLIGFSRQVRESLQTLRVQAASNPTAKTDILGAIRMAMEEFAAAPKNREKRLIIFSDFIQDDGTVNFNTDRRLASVKTATRYASEEAKIMTLEALSGKANLGLLRSKDLSALSKERREAIKGFWLQYLKSAGMEPTWATDGVGLLAVSARE